VSRWETGTYRYSDRSEDMILYMSALPTKYKERRVTESRTRKRNKISGGASYGPQDDSPAVFRSLQPVLPIRVLG